MPLLSLGADEKVQPRFLGILFHWVASSFFFFYFFLLHWVACEILVLQPGIEPIRPTVEAQSPNHWTTREFLTSSSFGQTCGSIGPEAPDQQQGRHLQANLQNGGVVTRTDTLDHVPPGQWILGKGSQLLGWGHPSPHTILESRASWDSRI